MRCRHMLHSQRRFHVSQTHFLRYACISICYVAQHLRLLTCAPSFSTLCHSHTGSHVNAVVYSDESCQSPIVKKTQLDGAIKLDLRKCNPTSGLFFAPGSFYRADCVVRLFRPFLLLFSSTDLFFVARLLFPRASFSRARAAGACPEPGCMGRHNLPHLLRNFCVYRLYVHQGIHGHAAWYCSKDCF
jgi:hypothetical protein